MNTIEKIYAAIDTAKKEWNCHMVPGFNDYVQDVLVRDFGLNLSYEEIEFELGFNEAINELTM